MPYGDRRNAPGTGHGSKSGRTGAAYRAAWLAVRGRAQQGEPCYFRHTYPQCPGGWAWDLPYNHAWAFTAHHLHRIMDGGSPVPDPAMMVPAHRSCNARDGLQAQNHRRAYIRLYGHAPMVAHTTDPTHCTDACTCVDMDTRTCDIHTYIYTTHSDVYCDRNSRSW
jgi:hypothetical protein